MGKKIAWTPAQVARALELAEQEVARLERELSAAQERRDGLAETLRKLSQ